MECISTSEEIGTRLREFRKRKCLTQEQLAEKMGVTPQQIHQYENGTSRLNTDKLQEASLALSVPVAAFFKGGDVESALSEDEQVLVNGFRAISSHEVRAFILHSLTDAKCHPPVQ